MIESETRTFKDPEGTEYVARLAPREIPSGVSQRVNSVTFETAEGEWIGAAPLYASISLADLSDFQLLNLFNEARLRG